MPKYKLCPRCELNYILEDENYCGVCKAELKIGPKLMFAVDEEEETEKLCPVCKQTYIPIGEDMCENCRDKSMYDIEESDIEERDENWREYLDDDEKDATAFKSEEEAELHSLDALQEEEAAEFAAEDEELEDEDYVAPIEDDFEYVSLDEADDDEDDDDEEDEESDDLGDENL